LEKLIIRKLDLNVKLSNSENMNTKIYKSSKNIQLIIETTLVFTGMSFLSVYIHQFQFENKFLKWFFYTVLLLFQGLWFYRLYIIGHEASHKKLFKKSNLTNDVFGSFFLMPLVTPINIYRKIHMFHHGFNRKDDDTSALDTFTTNKITLLKKVYFYTVWYVSVFFGGLFIHSLVSVILFLFIPPSISKKISPAFNGWTWYDQFKAIALFGMGIGFHYLVFYHFGIDVYLWVLGYPLLSFAWILSILVYIFHYKTTVGKDVRFNVRSVNKLPFFSWVLMNFNEHATHHQYPNIPWYDLPVNRIELPSEYAKKNQNTWNFFIAIMQQLKGPRIIEKDKK
jgi:fatty acid desaturase